MPRGGTGDADMALTGYGRPPPYRAIVLLFSIKSKVWVRKGPKSVDSSQKKALRGEPFSLLFLGGAIGYPFTAPAVMPSTKYFCTSANSMMTGTVVMVPSAMMMPQSICVELM